MGRYYIYYKALSRLCDVLDTDMLLVNVVLNIEQQANRSTKRKDEPNCHEGHTNDIVERYDC